MTSGAEAKIRGSPVLCATAQGAFGMFQQAFDFGHRRRFGHQPRDPQGCQIAAQAGRYRMVAGDECDRSRIPATAQFPHQSRAIETRQIDVNEGEMERTVLCSLKACQRFHGIGEDLDLVSAIGKLPRETGQALRLIINDE